MNEATALPIANMTAVELFRKITQATRLDRSKEPTMSDAINAARSALLLIWPDGPQCQHTHARTAFAALDKAEDREKELVEALEAMCGQYLAVRDGKLHHDCMSAGELAFDVLGWPDDGKPLDKEHLCEVEGCGNGWTCGWNGKDGKYHTLCNDHFKPWLDAGNGETPEQADERWTNDLRQIGMTDEQIAEHKTNTKLQQEQWKALHAKMPEPKPLELTQPTLEDVRNDIAKDALAESADAMGCLKPEEVA
jgi:hypothetical protein